MYDITPQQVEAEKSLIKQGFRFSNWISAQEETHPEYGCMVFKRKSTRFSTEYREVDPQGNIN